MPYKHQGRNRYGIDCIGFPIAMLRELGELPKGFDDITNYGRQPGGLMEPIVAQYCQKVAHPSAGSLVLIRWPQYKEATHAAIVTERTIIHSYQRAGKVIETGFRGPWVKNLHSAWLMPGVLYE